jgi:triacylglycerol esterase/lipase EstA (alpha/beta hydrolase family)
MRTSSTGIAHGNRFLTVVLAVALTLGCAFWQAVAGPSPAAHAATSVRPHLLLIHGYTDSCYEAFKNGGSDSAPDNSATVDYLTGNAHWATGDITTVGYYTHDYGSNDGGDSVSRNCDVDLNGSSAGSWANAGSWTTDTVNCNLDWQTVNLPPDGGTPFGTTYDPIMHLACLFAWYIYDSYTRTGLPVEILAHSMGGLITRAAIGGSSAGAAGFPPALLVPDVVTVATPQGGIGGIEATAAWWAHQSTEEVLEMEPGSTFMNTMGGDAYEKPQGAGNTHWALIGSSVPAGPPDATTEQSSSCAGTAGIPASWSLARVLGCLQEGVDSNIFPDGDGVVNAMSQMAMPADYKVLYGAVEDVDISVAKLYVADTATEYEHEINTCQDIISSTVATCTQPPFYLNDASTAP